jgi:NadR type nicotinamide-nucleotide adenylyltransferase
MVKKVVVIGPESTGKSVLCEKLSLHYNTIWCPEYAREYLFVLDREYHYDDLLFIAQKQLELAEKYTADAIQKKSSSIFFDTDMHVMKVWSEVVFGKCHPWILEQAAAQDSDLYLLCMPDIPWVDDGLREYPDLHVREDLYEIYKEILSQQNKPWIEISGNYERRFEVAVAAVDAMLK